MDTRLQRVRLQQTPTYNEFGYNRHPPSTSIFLCIQIIDCHVEKFGYKEHPLITSCFSCIILLDVRTYPYQASASMPALPLALYSVDTCIGIHCDTYEWGQGMIDSQASVSYPFTSIDIATAADADAWCGLNISRTQCKWHPV